MPVLRWRREENSPGPGLIFDLQSFPQFRILRGDSYGTSARVADSVLLAAAGNQGGRGDRHGIGAERQGFGEIGRDSQAAGDDQRDAVGPMVVQKLSGSVKCEDAGDRRRILDELRSGARGARASVHGDEIRFRRQCEFQIGHQISRGQLDSNRLAARPFAAARRPVASDRLCVRIS